MKTVMLVTNIPTPYRVPLFNEIDRQLKERGMKLFVVFGAGGYARRKWRVDMAVSRFEYVILDASVLAVAGEERGIFTYRGLGRVMKRVSPDVAVTAGFSPATTLFWLHSWIGDRPYIIWSGEIGSSRRSSRLLRRLQRRVVVRRAAAFIAYGSAAGDYLCSLGADPGRIRIVVNTVDTRFFREETERLRGERPDREGTRHLLNIGHLTAGKRIETLIRLVKELTRYRDDFVLEIVGDGPERRRLEDLAGALGVSEKIVFAGFRHQAELPAFLARADCFLFPSGYDVWGLVLVEAMAAGVPCFASSEAGATPDLIEEGRTGYVVDYLKEEETAVKIHRFLQSGDAAGRVGREAQKFIMTQATLELSAAGFVSAIESVTASATPPSPR